MDGPEGLTDAVFLGILLLWVQGGPFAVGAALLSVGHGWDVC